MDKRHGTAIYRFEYMTLVDVEVLPNQVNDNEQDR